MTAMVSRAVWIALISSVVLAFAACHSGGGSLQPVLPAPTVADRAMHELSRMHEHAPQVIGEFRLPFPGDLGAIAAGSDGNMWFTVSSDEDSQIGRITPFGSISGFRTPTFNSQPLGIAAGLDGNTWFTETFVDKIGKITPSGIITEFAIPTPGAFPAYIAAGRDGNMWFTELVGDKIGRIAPSGAITEFTIPTLDAGPWSIAGQSFSTKG